MEEDYLKKLADDIKKQHQEKTNQYKSEVLDSKQYKQEVKYLNDFSLDAIQTIRHIALYSTRAKYIYDNFLTIAAGDGLIQSIVGIRELALNGIHNMAKREIRYLLEMIVKYLIVDQEQANIDIKSRTQYLKDNLPNSSIEVIERLALPFDIKINQEFKNDVKDLFYKSCAYVHPSKKQIDEQLNNYAKGHTIGFETAKMLADINKILFRAYDMILTMLFIGFGHSMSGDLFIQIYDDEPKWKFHKGKYVNKYSHLFDYKLERQRK